jgi:outer membrane protein assembly factor BamB
MRIGRAGVTVMLATLVFVAAACSDDDEDAAGTTAASAGSDAASSPSTAAATSSSEPAAAATTEAGSTATTGAPTATGVAPTTPPPGSPVEYADNPGDWVLPGRDYDNSRATFDSTITADNIDDLEVVWEAEIAAGLSTVPLIVGDTVYVQDGSGRISAFDRSDGARRWESAQYGFGIGPYGVAVADGRVFGLHGSKGVVAVDAESGAELWVRDITATPTAGIDIQPTVFDGLVLVSTVPVSIGGIYAPGDRGILHALDAETGDVVWTFDTVEGDDLWGHPEVNSGGGAWYPPSIDPVAGVVYWGIANPAPFPGTPEFPNGSSRPGPNLYTNSALALDVRTGELLWYHQVIPHDLFDRDLVHTLVARPADGDAVVIATGKGATVVGLDPETGDRLWETPVGIHRNDDLAELSGPTEIWPGTFGGVITPPATADGIVYVVTLNAPSTLPPDATAYFGGELGTADGEVVAIDAADGSVLWTTTVPGDPLGAATVVNDLVFTALLDGEIVALDRDTGEILWLEQAPGGINGWMSAAGDLLVVPVGMANPPRLVAYGLP